MHLIIPMAGAGSRFAKAGYETPKPFLPVDGEPMVLRVVRDCARLAGEGNLDSITFLCRKEHMDRMQEIAALADKFLDREYDDSPRGSVRVISVPEITQGAACTVLLAEHEAMLDGDVLIANSDQVFNLGWQKFFDRVHRGSPEDRPDAAVLTFDDPDPNPDGKKWSYFVTDSQGAAEIIEKPGEFDNIRCNYEPTCGVYWFRYGGDLFNAIRRMIRLDGRVNGEFYLAPAINYLEPFTVRASIPVYSFAGLGTPEDYEAYMKPRQTTLRNRTQDAEET